MTDLDLTAAIAAAAHAVHVAIAHNGTTPPYCDGPNDPQRDDAHAAVAAAAPLIAQQVAEQIAQAIERERRWYGSVIGESPMPEGSQHSARDGGILYGLDRAAHIAREWGEQQ